MEAVQLTKGTFLIGAPDDLEKGLYARSVILLCEHNVGGSFGLIINKPLNMEFPEELVSLSERANTNVSLLCGGSLQPNQMILLHSNDSIPDQTLSICDGVFLGGDLEFLQKEMTEPDGSNINLCFGYTAWGAGQLERELLSGLWFAHPASDEYVFKTDPTKIWQALLKNMGGKYATLAMIPEDLSLN
jgi:putative transcriptional regulator